MVMEIDDEAVMAAARTLVRNILRVARGERFVAVGDLETVSLLGVLERVARETGAEVAALRIDQLRSHATNHSGDRPHKVLPDAVRRAMLSAQASVFVASAPDAEGAMREQLEHIVRACRIRHAHLPGISSRAFERGLAADHARMADAASALMRLVDGVRSITATSEDGTDLVVEPGAGRWVARIGRVGPGESVVFPVGSLVVPPVSVRGSFAATASLGALFDARASLLTEPVVFDIEGGVVKAVRCSGSPRLASDVDAMIGATPDGRKIRHVVLGLDADAAEPIGSVALDQHRPGLHLVIGDPRRSFVACAESNSVAVDGILVMQGGRLLFA